MNKKNRTITNIIVSQFERKIRDDCFKYTLKRWMDMELICNQLILEKFELICVN